MTGRRSLLAELCAVGAVVPACAGERENQPMSKRLGMCLQRAVGAPQPKHPSIFVSCIVARPTLCGPVGKVHMNVCIQSAGRFFGGEGEGGGMIEFHVPTRIATLCKSVPKMLSINEAQRSAALPRNFRLDSHADAACCRTAFRPFIKCISSGSTCCRPSVRLRSFNNARPPHTHRKLRRKNVRALAWCLCKTSNVKEFASAGELQPTDNM